MGPGEPVCPPGMHLSGYMIAAGEVSHCFLWKMQRTYTFLANFDGVSLIREGGDLVYRKLVEVLEAIGKLKELLKGLVRAVGIQLIC